MRVTPELSAVSARGFASFEERERGEEACAAHQSIPHDILMLPVPMLLLQLCMPSSAVPCPSYYAKKHSDRLAIFCTVFCRLPVKIYCAIPKH